MAFLPGSGDVSGAASPIQRTNSGPFRVDSGENVKDRDPMDKEKNSGGLGGGGLPIPPTLEELGMGGLVNYEVMDRAMNSTKRRRWRV